MKAFNNLGELLVQVATGTSSGGNSWSIENESTDYVVLTTDSGKIFTNEGATGQVIFTLPLCNEGRGPFRFLVKEAFNLRILAPASTVIIFGDVTSAAAGYIESSLPGSIVEIVGVSNTEYLVQSSLGTWSVT